MSHNHHPPGFAHALEVLRKSLESVPGFARHLAQHGLDGRVSTPEEFAAIPPTSKDNFIRSNHIDQLMPNREVTQAWIWSSSSGSSGRPTYWPRAATSLYESIELYDQIFRNSFQSTERSTLAVIAFGMGTWIGGTYTLTALLRLPDLGHKLSVITPGITIDAILDALATLGPRYEQVVLIGYPPFVKDILDHADAGLLGQDLKILMAGEAITEGWRDHVLSRTGNEGQPERTCLIYGTAEAGIMGNETPLTISVRRAALADRALAEDLFGTSMHGIEVQPTFVEYEPHFRYVETDADGYLLFTCETTLPLVRYRINDRGAVFSGHDLADVLHRRGYHQLAEQVRVKKGYIALHGRSDIAALFYSINIYPENLRRAFEDQAVTAAVTGKFTLSVDTNEHHDQTLRLAVELRADTDPCDGLATLIADLAVSALKRTNSEFRALHDMRGAPATPAITLHRFGTGGFAAATKHRWTKE